MARFKFHSPVFWVCLCGVPRRCPEAGGPCQGELESGLSTTAQPELLSCCTAVLGLGYSVSSALVPGLWEQG